LNSTGATMMKFDYKGNRGSALARKMFRGVLGV
jgi:hypothetical protein